MTAVSGTVVVTVTLFAMPGGGIAVDVTQYNEQTVELPALRLSCSTSDLRESRKQGCGEQLLVQTHHRQIQESKLHNTSRSHAFPCKRF